MARFDREQRRSTIRERWINVAFAFLGAVAGYALNLLDTDYIKDLFYK